MDYRLSNAWALNAAGAVTAIFLLFSAAGAEAAPTRLDCTLTTAKTKVGSKSDFEPENRPMSVIFDDQAKTLSVSQDGNVLALKNVTATVTSINGYVDQVSIGINSADWSVVFQTYDSGSTRSEFGACSVSTQSPPS